MNSLLRLFALLMFLAFAAAPSVASAAFAFQFAFGNNTFCNANTICSVANTLLFLINNVAVPLLFAVAFIVFLYGVAKSYIFSVGDAEEVKKGHTLILWGLIGFAVIISVWGLVNVIVNTFGLGGFVPPPIPSL